MSIQISIKSVMKSIESDLDTLVTGHPEIASVHVTALRKDKKKNAMWTVAVFHKKAENSQFYEIHRDARMNTVIKSHIYPIAYVRPMEDADDADYVTKCRPNEGHDFIYDYADLFLGNSMFLDLVCSPIELTLSTTNKHNNA